MNNRLKFKLYRDDKFITQPYYIRLYNKNKLIAEFYPATGMFNKEQVIDYCLTHLGFSKSDIEQLMEQ